MLIVMFVINRGRFYQNRKCLCFLCTFFHQVKFGISCRQCFRAKIYNNLSYSSRNANVLNCPCF
jgi:hypothetical protein